MLDLPMTLKGDYRSTTAKKENILMQAFPGNWFISRLFPQKLKRWTGKSLSREKNHGLLLKL